MDLNKLKQEAEEYGKKATAWLEDREPLDQRDIENAYLAGAEPREKRIAVLEKRCANYEMTISKMEKGNCDICKEIEKDKKIEELEAQIEKMKCCGNCKNYWFCLEECCRKNISFEKGICYDLSEWEIKEK